LQLAPSPGQKQTSFAEEPVPDLPQTALIPATFEVLQFWPANKHHLYTQILHDNKSRVNFKDGKVNFNL
jgi:hypothetical protein